MTLLTQEIVMTALRTVKDPEIGRDVVSLNMIKDLKIEDGNRVSLTLVLTTPACPIKGEFQETVRQALLGAGAVEAAVNLSSDTSRFTRFGTAETGILSGVKNTIAVASGKGGVGKSTVTANLALALANEGAKVGVMDADIYGPTIPLMMNVHELPPPVNGRIMPPVRYQAKVMSMGLILPKGEAVVWRGPMVAKMVQQFLTAVDWGDLDYLLIDLPPGTGDAALTIAQMIPLTGVVVVTTPQEAATAIATKAISMFGKLNVPILGIIENMGYHQCSACGHQESIFGEGGGQRASEDNGIPFLGQIPLDAHVRESGDKGKPIVVFYPDAPASAAFKEIAGKMAGRISVLHANQALELPVIS